MGYMRHHAIVVTSWNERMADEAHAKATELGMQVSALVASAINGYQSFLVAPDGSKEGWDESNQGNERRAAFVAYLDGLRYSDGSTSVAWVEVQYDDDERETKIVSHSDEPARIEAADQYRQPAPQGNAPTLGSAPQPIHNQGGADA